MLISSLDSEQNKCYVQWEGKEEYLPKDVNPLLGPDEHNLPKNLMLKGNFISLVWILTGLYHLKNKKTPTKHKRTNN